MLVTQAKAVPLLPPAQLLLHEPLLHTAQAVHLPRGFWDPEQEFHNEQVAGP